MLIRFFGFAQNPICPIGTYIADPTARVWKDGKLYIYGSTDESSKYWCSYKHDVLFSSDLLNWNIVNNIIASKGKNDSIQETNALLYAPDAMYRNDTYYLYYCTPDKHYSEGVATSNNPLGPFGNAKRLNIGKFTQIDPTIFIDNDGQAYYYWGQGNLKGAKMKSNMVELDSSTIKDNIITNKEHFFHEGSFVFKRNNLYYVLFADESRRNHKPTCLGYAIGNSPLGPFTYKGVVIDNYGCDPKSWNNHGSIAAFKGQWYVFYHRSSQGCKTMRRACVEPIQFNADGTIDEVEMTSQGTAKSLSAFSITQAERACLLFGNCIITYESVGNEMIAEIRNNDKAAYKYLDFGKGAKRFMVKARALKGGAINIRIGGMEGKIIGSVKISTQGEKVDFQSYSCSIEKTKGKQAVYLEFIGESNEDNLFDIDSFSFLK